MSCGVGRRCGLDLVLLWLWCRLAAATQIRLLAWELPYAMGAGLKSKEKKKERKKESAKRKEYVGQWTSITASSAFIHVLWTSSLGIQLWELNLLSEGWLSVFLCLQDWQMALAWGQTLWGLLCSSNSLASSTHIFPLVWVSSWIRHLIHTGKQPTSKNIESTAMCQRACWAKQQSGPSRAYILVWQEKIQSILDRAWLTTAHGQDMAQHCLFL